MFYYQKNAFHEMNIVRKKTQKVREKFAQVKKSPYICTAFKKSVSPKQNRKTGSLGEWLKPAVC